MKILFIFSYSSGIYIYKKPSLGETSHFRVYSYANFELLIFFYICFKSQTNGKIINFNLQ